MRGFNFLNKSDYYVLVLVLLTLLSRILVSENYFFGYDSVNYALGVIDFSLEATRPHLPGSLLFVKSIEIVNLLLNDVHQSFLLILYLFSILATLISFRVFLKYFDAKKSFVLTLFLIFNPMVWFYGAVTEIYVFDWFFASLVFYLSFRKDAIYILPIIFVVGSGFRPSSGVLLLPFYFFLISKEKTILWKKLFGFFIFALFLFLLWFIPLINNAGGLWEYLELFSTNNPMEQISIAQNIFRLSSLIIYLLLPFILLIFVSSKKKIRIIAPKILSILFFVIPPILFFFFSHYSKGYALLIVTPLVLLIGLGLKRNYAIPTIVVIIFEIALFIFLPSSSTSLESKIKPSIRKSGIEKIWLDRTLSDYSLAFNNINNRDHTIKILIEIIIKSGDSQVFLDPLLSQFGRALQIYFPDKVFFAINFRNPKEFISFKNLDVYKKGINTIICLSVFFPKPIPSV